MSTLTDFLAQVNRMMGPRSVALDAADYERHLRDAERLRSLRRAHRPGGRSKRAPRVNAARRSGMYGKQCPSVGVSIGVLAGAIIEYEGEARLDPDTRAMVLRALRGANEDSMGRGVVTYFPTEAT